MAHNNKPKTLSLAALAVLAGCLILLPAISRAHCDTLGGPVVKDGRAALEKRDITPVLKWVKPEHETELRQVFDEALSVRAKGPDAAGLADRHFLETLVRLHRMGEGAPYTGLKDAPAEPIVAMADKALFSGSERAMLKALDDHLAKVLAGKFQRVLAASKAKDTSVEAGRAFVEAYVDYTHYLEALHAAIAGSGPDHH
jgi:hypothetical protein